ncbi:MAG: universal stress protein [Sphingobacteriales bacterium]|nr:MAG: universal stress protein [Sphingobacteriales bacterium]
MTTVIVPVDFSETSLNAARYAAAFLKGHYSTSIILYHSYANTDEAIKTGEQLETLKAQLIALSQVNVEILNHHEADFVDGLERAARHRRADLVIMGITGKSAIQQALFGSNTLKMAATKACPVLIIPEGATFVKMKNVMLTSDFKDTLNTTPSVPIKQFLSIYNSKLHVVNVDKEHYISLTEKYESEKQDLKTLLGEFDPEFYFMRMFDLEESLDLFAKDFDIDLIIAVQREQSLMQRLFTTSHTKRFAYHSSLPILVIHE